MKRNAKLEIVATVERERERESYSLFNIEFVYLTKYNILDKKINLSRCIERYAYFCCLKEQNKHDTYKYECKI